MATLRLARHAMATRFEILLSGENVSSLRGAGEEALSEIERLEAKLSLFRPSSEISRVNARAPFEEVRVSPPVFALLQHAQALTLQTEGAFDITVAPLMRCWGFHAGTGRVPSEAELQAARECVGMLRLVHLNTASSSVRFERPGVMLDLGAIGKGYAIDRAVEILVDAGIENALIHGGTSTVYGLGTPPDSDSWKIEIPSPATKRQREAEPQFATNSMIETIASSGSMEPAPHPQPFATVNLRNNSLSVSAVWGKFFQSNGRSFGHIIDPRTGEPASQGFMSAVVLPAATETDALSTALMTLGVAGSDLIAKIRPGTRWLVANECEGKLEVRSQGIEVRPKWNEMP